MAQPRLIEGVWIGRLDDEGFVVFEPDLTRPTNPLLDGRCVVSLWSERKRGRLALEINNARVALRKNLGQVSDADRRRLATAYWSWMCDLVGGAGCTRSEYLHELDEIQTRITAIESDNDAEADSFRAINRGENPHYKKGDY